MTLRMNEIVLGDNTSYSPINSAFTEAEVVVEMERVMDLCSALFNEEDKLLRDNMAKSFGSKTVDRMNRGEYDELPSQRTRTDRNEEEQAYGSDDFFAQLKLVRAAKKLANILRQQMLNEFVVTCIHESCKYKFRPTTSWGIKSERCSVNSCDIGNGCDCKIK